MNTPLSDSVQAAIEKEVDAIWEKGYFASKAKLIEHMLIGAQIALAALPDKPQGDLEDAILKALQDKEYTTIKAIAAICHQHFAPKVAAVEAERDVLQRFKDFVHRRLDEMGVPTHPDGEHSKAGCRIGDRLDIVQASIAERDAFVSRLTVFLSKIGHRTDQLAKNAKEYHAEKRYDFYAINQGKSDQLQMVFDELNEILTNQKTNHNG